MPNSDFIYESGEAIYVGAHGRHNYVYASGEPVSDAGKSGVVFESGVGLGGGQIIEDWERSSPLGDYFGETSSWGTGGTPYNGDHAGHTTTNNTEIWSLEGDGLPYYPQRGDIVEFYGIVATSDSGVEMDCLVVQEETQYEFQIHGFQDSSSDADVSGDGALGIIKRNKQDTGTVDATDGVLFGSTPPLGEYVRGEIHLGDPTLSFEVFSQDANGDFTNSLGSGSLDDSEFTSRGVGWSSSQSTSTSNTDVTVDYARKVGTI